MGLKREIVRGEPIKLGEREIVPEAVIWSWRRSEATLSQNGQAAMWGGLFRWARPTALFERTTDRTYRIPVSDVNHRLEALLLIAAVLLPIVLNAAVSLMHTAGLTRRMKE
jgi:hypothetical protein